MKQTWTCSCGQENNENFCSACGKPKPQDTTSKPVNTTNNNEWVCPICGEKNTEKFCSNCGHNHDEDTNTTNLDATQIVPPVAPPPAPKPQPIKNEANYIPPQQPNNYTNVPQQQPKKSNSKYIMGGIIGILAVLVIVFGVKAMQNTSSDSSNTTNTPAITTSSSSDNVKQAPTAQSDLSLGGVDLGDTIDQFHDVLGLEDSTKQKGNYMFYNYASIQVGVKDGKVDALVSQDTSVETKRGIHQGSTIQDVFAKYGTDYMQSTYDGLTLYEYNFKSIDNRDGILRFAINSSNQVQYISVRIPDDGSSSDNAASAQEAQQTLMNYYAAISKHNMRAAYNLLSADMQTHMGDLDAYAAGYKDTLMSMASDINVTSNSGDEVALSYKLTSRDRFDRGDVKVQYFSCTALLSKKTGSWHITNLSAKKTGEDIETR